MLGDVLVDRHRVDFVPLGLLQYTVEVIDDNLHEALGAFYGEERVVAQH